MRRLPNPERAFWSGLENRPASAISGAIAKRRGCRSGLPDLVLIARGRPPVFVEMKSKSGYLSDNQKDVRAELLRVGCAYWVAMTARAALTALLISGAPFRRPWTPPPLAGWEGPHTDTVRIRRAPEILERRREEQRRARERKRARAP
jgi:hypothetical protein